MFIKEKSGKTVTPKMTFVEKTTEQLEVGDTIMVWWHPNIDVITALRPYTGALLPPAKAARRVCFARNRTEMIYVAGQVFHVLTQEQSKRPYGKAL